MVIETVVFTGLTSWRGKCSSRRPRGRIGARPEVLLGDCHVGHGAASRGRELLRLAKAFPTLVPAPDDVKALGQFASPYFVASGRAALNVQQVRLGVPARSRLVWLATCPSAGGHGNAQSGGPSGAPRPRRGAWPGALRYAR